MRVARPGVVSLAALVAFVPAAADAQRPTATRKATTIAALLAHPAFFHGQPIRLQGHATPLDQGSLQLFANEQSLTVLLASGGGAAAESPKERIELVGTFYDLGRLDANDVRLGRYDVRGLSQRLVHKDWPSIGELPVVIAETVTLADASPVPTIRAIVLDADRFADLPVTLTGRFRGRNLFGDLPDAPGRSQWDFVLQSADAALWVTGLRPRGKGFELHVDARVDTSRWLEVRGTVRVDRQRFWVEGTSAALAEPPAEPTQPDAVVTVPSVGPPPEVVFSVPTAGEADVARDTLVRLQFSRDMNAATFRDRVKVGYLVQESEERGEPAPPPIEAAFRYDDGRRTLEIRFRQPLDRFRTVRISLLDGIEARDGARLAPWTLSFSVGG